MSAVGFPGEYVHRIFSSLSVFSRHKFRRRRPILLSVASPAMAFDGHDDRSLWCQQQKRTALLLYSPSPQPCITNGIVWNHLFANGTGDKKLFVGSAEPPRFVVS